MEVPLPRACSKRLMSFFTFHISMFFSASLAWGALIASEGEDYDRSGSRCCRVVVWCPEFPKSYPCEEFRILLVYRIEKPKVGFFLGFMPSGLAGLAQAVFSFLMDYYYFRVVIHCSLSFPIP